MWDPKFTLSPSISIFLFNLLAIMHLHHFPAFVVHHFWHQSEDWSMIFIDSALPQFLSHDRAMSTSPTSRPCFAIVLVKPKTQSPQYHWNPNPWTPVHWNPIPISTPHPKQRLSSPRKPQSLNPPSQIPKRKPLQNPSQAPHSDTLNFIIFPKSEIPKPNPNFRIQIPLGSKKS